MDIIFGSLNKLKKKDFDFKVEKCWKYKYRLKSIIKAFKKIMDSGDENKILYASNLFSYFSILNNLYNLVKKNEIFIEENDKYYCEEFFYYLEDQVCDTTMRVINAIICAVANDKSLDNYHRDLFLFCLDKIENIKENNKEINSDIESENKN